MSMKETEPQKESALEKASTESRLETYSPRALMAISFLESLRWLTSRIKSLLNRPATRPNNPPEREAMNLPRELRAQAAAAKNRLHRSF